ncbi:MAG: SH3 domain-containing protein, partial [Chloroflexaceae bacterium]|nr:SH3 domain-containing protein [Chloroflexaceae bacterium]
RLEECRQTSSERSTKDQGVLRSVMEKFQELEGRVAQTESEDAPNRMEVGSAAWVRRAGGQNLNRRDAPGLNSQVLDHLPIGMRLTLLEGPNPADGYTWWRVRASDGREGWVAGEELVTQPE